MRKLVVLAIALTSTVQLSQTQARHSTSLPASFERLLAGAVKPTALERKRLLDGAPVTKLLDADPSKEIGIFGAVWIDAPRERYAAAVKDIEHFESGGHSALRGRLVSHPSWRISRSYGCLKRTSPISATVRSETARSRWASTQ